MTCSANCSAIVLAGGQSSRMGQDKALIPINGVPMLTHVCRVALACVDTVHIVTPWPDRYRAIAPTGCTFIQEQAWPLATVLGTDTSQSDPASSNTRLNPRANARLNTASNTTLPLNHGPLVGFAQGLAQVNTEWVLLLACDLPLLNAELIQSWLLLLQTVPKDAIALLAHSEKGWEPLCGFYRSSCLESLQGYIASGQRSFQHWLHQASVRALPDFDKRVLFNCNTPVDLRKIQESSEIKKPG